MNDEFYLKLETSEKSEWFSFKTGKLKILLFETFAPVSLCFFDLRVDVYVYFKIN